MTLHLTLYFKTLFVRQRQRAPMCWFTSLQAHSSLDSAHTEAARQDLIQVSCATRIRNQMTSVVIPASLPREGDLGGPRSFSWFFQIIFIPSLYSKNSLEALTPTLPD